MTIFDILYNNKLSDISSKTVTLELVIEALAPISINHTIPGNFYIAANSPTKSLIYGLIENALGLHFSDPKELKTKDENKAVIKSVTSVKRTAVIKKLEKLHKLEYQIYGNHFSPLIQHHLDITEIQPPLIKLSYADMWTKNLHHSERAFNSGRVYDYRLSRIPAECKGVSANRKEYTITKYDENTILNEDDLVSVNAIQDNTPLYYGSPVVREFHIWETSCVVKILTSLPFSRLLISKLTNPDHHLYLGTSEGLVSCNCSIISSQ